MKIEIGESLVSSWLKHVNGCQIVQENWKISSLWETSIEPRVIEKMFNSLKKSFKEDELTFISKNQKSTQMIKQGEVDCLGIKMILNDDRVLIVDSIYAVDIAFHEGGLNYGKIEETKSRLRKKMIRTAFSLYQLLGVKKGEIIFATPKVPIMHESDIKQTALDVSKHFNNAIEGGEFNFKVYCGEDFKNFIVEPVLEIINENSDSNELFARSTKLLNLFGLLNNDKKDVVDNLLKVNKLNSSSGEFTKATNLKIGVYVQNIFKELELENKLTQEVVNKLLDKDISKDLFNINFPVLKEDSGDKNDAFDEKGRARYYLKKTYSFNKKEYLLCNHWYEKDNRVKLEEWYNSL